MTGVGGRRGGGKWRMSPCHYCAHVHCQHGYRPGRNLTLMVDVHIKPDNLPFLIKPVMKIRRRAVQQPLNKEDVVEPVWDLSFQYATISSFVWSSDC